MNWWKPRPVIHRKEENLPVNIYYLVDPRNDEIFYIGKTRNELRERLNQHIADARKGNRSAKSRRISEILQDRAKPRISLIEITNTLEYQDRERYWVKAFRDHGYALLNSDRGGGGMV